MLASSGASSATSPVVNINENNAPNAVIFDSDAYRYNSDTGQQSKDTNIIYTFADTNQQTSGIFTIERFSGVVTVSQSLDYETATSHQVVIKADGGIDGSSNDYGYEYQTLTLNRE